MALAPLVNGIELAIFDVDGTLVETKSGKDFRASADDWQLLPGRAEAIAALHARRITVALASNQGGIAFGYLAEPDMDAAMFTLAEMLDIPVALAFYCPYHPNASLRKYRGQSFDRKPRPGMLMKAMLAAQIGPRETLMVGDRDEDREAAVSVGVAYLTAAEFFAPGIRPQVGDTVINIFDDGRSETGCVLSVLPPDHPRAREHGMEGRTVLELAMEDGTTAWLDAAYADLEQDND